MKVRAALLAVVLVLLVATESMAVPGNAVFWAASNPTTPAGKIQGEGTYQAANGWGPVVINNVPTGQYTVFAQITFKKAGAMQFDIVNSPVAVVNVP